MNNNSSSNSSSNNNKIIYEIIQINVDILQYPDNFFCCSAAEIAFIPMKSSVLISYCEFGDKPANTEMRNQKTSILLCFSSTSINQLTEWVSRCCPRPWPYGGPQLERWRHCVLVLEFHPAQGPGPFLFVTLPWNSPPLQFCPRMLYSPGLLLSCAGQFVTPIYDAFGERHQCQKEMTFSKVL